MKVKNLFPISNNAPAAEEEPSLAVFTVIKMLLMMSDGVKECTKNSIFIDTVRHVTFTEGAREQERARLLEDNRKTPRKTKIPLSL